MTPSIINRLQSIVDNELTYSIIPVKTKYGIRIGNIDIVNDGSLKHVKVKGKIKFEGIFLNATAITLANMLAHKKYIERMNKIYEADQRYGRFFIDSQILRYHYNHAVQDQDRFKRDVFWARYTTQRDKVMIAKKQVEELIRS